jgi:cell division protein FtsZ
LRRLEAAVRKVPGETGPVAPSMGHAPHADKSRFGINSLINRMTGHPEGAPAPKAERAAAPARREAPQVSRQEKPELSAEQERIEIPAFLRRQAN